MLFRSGHLLYPGKKYTGMLKVKDIGIPKEAFFGKKPQAFCYESQDIPMILPVRALDGNKGTFGKVILIAGSRDMSGACLLCAKAVLRAGAGMVKIITPACNREIVQIALPEAMLYTFEETPCREKLWEAFSWADVAVAGPGMGTDENARMLMEYVLEQNRIPTVIDADGLNLLAAHKELEKHAENGAGKNLILTPHPGELGRLLKTGKEEYRREREQDRKSVVQGSSDVLWLPKTRQRWWRRQGERKYILTRPEMTAWRPLEAEMFLQALSGDF